MDRHFIALTYLEWLNWAARGMLRVSRERIIWAPADAEEEAFRSGMRTAPDLDPADDAFLLAILDRAPRHSLDGTSSDALLDGVRFEALSERSRRLLGPTAERMQVVLGETTAALQQAWVQWKRDYQRRLAEQRARRFWAWAQGRAWSHDPTSIEAKLQSQIVKLEKKISDLVQVSPEKMQRVSGTDAGAWYEIVLCAKQDGTLSPEENASWKTPVISYLKQAQKRPQMSKQFFRVDDPKFKAALAAFAHDREKVASLLAFAIARHHAFRMSVGLAPDMLAFNEDLGSYVAFYSGAHEGDVFRQGVGIALIALAQALPDEAITPLVFGSGLKPGWADGLLRPGMVVCPTDAGHNEVSPAKSARSPEKETSLPGPDDLGRSEPQIACQDGTPAPERLLVEEGMQLGTEFSAPSLPIESPLRTARKAPSARKRGPAKAKAPPDSMLL